MIFMISCYPSLPTLRQLCILDFLRIFSLCEGWCKGHLHLFVYVHVFHNLYIHVTGSLKKPLWQIVRAL